MRINQNWLREKLEERGYRADAGETAVLARQLEYIFAQTYDVLTPALKARQLIPVDTSVPPGAESYTYRAFEMIGMASIIANYADDLPNVDALAFEVTKPIKSIGDCYRYSIQDLRNSAMSGFPLDQARARAARIAIEQAIDYIAAFGDTLTGLTGLLNHPNVGPVTFDNAPWDTATALEILADMQKLARAPWVATKELQVPDTMLLDPYAYGIIADKPMSTTGDSADTVLRRFLATNEFIKQVVPWSRCTDAGSGNVTRAMVYPRDPSVVSLILPQDFEQFPPQPKNLAFEVPCHARVGGVTIRYPLACAYADGAGEQSA